jgi:hypothetical protein
VVNPSQPLAFPELRAQPVPSWVPRSDLRKLKQIDHWLQNTQHALAALHGQSPEHHLALRRIANDLKANVVAQWTPSPKP